MDRQKRPLMPPGGHFIGTIRLGSYDIWAGIGGYLNYRGTRNNPHAHSHHEVCLVLAGAGWFDHDGVRYGLHADDLFLSHPGVTHEIISHATDHLKICFISFSVTGTHTEQAGTEMDTLIQRFEQDRKVLVPAAGRLGLYFQALAGLQPYTDAGAYAESTMAIAGLVTAIMNAAVQQPGAAVPAKAHRDPRLTMAFRYMDDNLNRPLSVPELARQAFTSERSLRRLIQVACGCTVIREFARRRIDAAARRLVSHPEKGVAEVAFDMGFADAAQFCREFKAMKGMTPGEWRRKQHSDA